MAIGRGDGIYATLLFRRFLPRYSVTLLTATLPSTQDKNNSEIWVPGVNKY